VVVVEKLEEVWNVFAVQEEAQVTTGMSLKKTTRIQ